MWDLFRAQLWLPLQPPHQPQSIPPKIRMCWQSKLLQPTSSRDAQDFWVLTCMRPISLKVIIRNLSPCLSLELGLRMLIFIELHSSAFSVNIFCSSRARTTKTGIGWSAFKIYWSRKTSEPVSFHNSCRGGRNCGVRFESSNRIDLKLWL